jgi:hypothetical protein
LRLNGRWSEGLSYHSWQFSLILLAFFLLFPLVVYVACHAIGWAMRQILGMVFPRLKE